MSNILIGWLQVNGEEMTGLSQTAAVAILRDIPVGSAARLVISRQGDDAPPSGPPPPPLPTSLPPLLATESLPATLASVDVTSSLGEGLLDSSPVIDGRRQSKIGQMTNKILNSFHSRSASSGGQISTERENGRRISTESFQDGDLRFGSERSGQVAGVSRHGNHAGDEIDGGLEALTFNVALGEAGPAGLGITVQKMSERGQDLGISIKSVIVGGAVSKVRFDYNMDLIRPKTKTTSKQK